MNNVCTEKSACDKAVDICDQEEGMECNIECCSEDLYNGDDRKWLGR